MNKNEEREVVDLHAKTIGHIGGYNHHTLIESQNSTDLSPHLSLGNVSNPIELSQDNP